MSTETETSRQSFQQGLPAHWFVVAPLVLLGLAMTLRIIDIYVLHLDERLGEMIISKSLAFALVVDYAGWVGLRLAAIGLHTRKLGSALAIGAGITSAAFLIATIIQIPSLEPGQSLTLRAIDPKTGMTGGPLSSPF